VASRPTRRCSCRKASSLRSVALSQLNVKSLDGRVGKVALLIIALTAASCASDRVASRSAPAEVPPPRERLIPPWLQPAPNVWLLVERRAGFGGWPSFCVGVTKDDRLTYLGSSCVEARETQSRTLTAAELTRLKQSVSFARFDAIREECCYCATDDSTVFGIALRRQDGTRTSVIDNLDCDPPTDGLRALEVLVAEMVPARWLGRRGGL
jgi:hypothetical protein